MVTATESAPYTVVSKENGVEIRDYPALRVVETPMPSGRQQGADGGFRRLFRYISGANEGNQEIAMTTPVFMSGEPAASTMAFVLPASFTAETAPRPTDAAVRLRELPPGRFAVLRFAGGRNAANESAALVKLLAALEAKNLSATGAPIYGYFNPPWTPTFLRRNEVMLPLARPPEPAPD
jgi:DNA gyrase inhibitor GyrI